MATAPAPSPGAQALIERVEDLRARHRDTMANLVGILPTAVTHHLGIAATRDEAWAIADSAEPAVVEPWGDWWMVTGLGVAR